MREEQKKRRRKRRLARKRGMLSQCQGAVVVVETLNDNRGARQGAASGAQ